MRKIVLIIYFIAFFKTPASLNIECSYGLHNYPHVQFISCCHVMNVLQIEFNEKALIKFVSGTYTEKNEAAGFRIYNKTTLYFPRGLENDFKNLRVIEISHGHLRDIRQENLKSFGMLEVLYLYSNDIEILEEGLFDDNVNLKFITLSGNRIIHIDRNVFDNLHQLVDLYLNRNECVDLQSDNFNPLEKVINAMKYTCKNADYADLYKSLIVLETVKRNLKLEDFSSFYKNLTNLDNLISKKNFQNTTARTRMQELKDWSFEVLWSDISNFNKFLTHFNASVLERLNYLEQNLHNIRKQASSEIYKKNHINAENFNKIENNPSLAGKLKEVQASQINEINLQNDHEEDSKYNFTWELFWIGFCGASIIFLIIVLIKNYFLGYRIISYTVSNSYQYDN